MGLAPLFQVVEKKGEGEGTSLGSLLSSPSPACWGPCHARRCSSLQILLKLLPSADATHSTKVHLEGKMQTAARSMGLPNSEMQWGLQESPLKRIHCDLVVVETQEPVLWKLGPQCANIEVGRP